MNCDWELLLPSESPPYAAQVARAVFDEVDRLERELSRFVPTSDVSRINSLRPSQTLRIGIDAMACLGWPRSFTSIRPAHSM